jgi:hypothetical protein
MTSFSHRRAGILSAFFFAALLVPAWAWTPGTGSPDAVQGFVVDSSDRTDVLAFYNTIYTASEGYAQNIAWTGSVAAGQAGTTSAVFKDDVRRRVNFYRALTGLPAVFKGTFNRTVSGRAVSTAYEGVVLANPLTLPGESAPVRGAGFFTTPAASGAVLLEP